MAEWIDPKEDWSPSATEGVAGDDFNRIEGNIKFLFDKEYFPITFNVALDTGSELIDITQNDGSGFLQRSGKKVTLVMETVAAYTVPALSDPGELVIVINEDIPNRYKITEAFTGTRRFSPMFTMYLEAEGVLSFWVGSVVIPTEDTETFDCEIRYWKFESPLVNNSIESNIIDVSGKFFGLQTSWGTDEE